MMVELRDGRLWMLLRTRYGIAESYSRDAGRTWTEPRKSPIENPSTRFFLRRLASGRLLLVKNGPIATRLPGRTHLTAFLSDDDGKSWGSGLLLDERNAVSYPDGFQSADGRIQILYDWNRHTDAEILLATFREEDVLAGRFVSPGAAARVVVDKARAPRLSAALSPTQESVRQATADAKADFSSIPYDGIATKRLVSDALLRPVSDGAWSLILRVGRDADARRSPGMRRTFSRDQGKTWAPLETLDAGFPRAGDTVGQGPFDLVPLGDRAALIFSTYAETWTNQWRAWWREGDPASWRWETPVALPGDLATRTFARNAISTVDGRILVPFQHYESGDRAFSHPRCGVLASSDQGKTWTESGHVRLSPIDRNFAWTESHLVELTAGRLVMLVRQAGLMGLLYVAESPDGGRTWPEVAKLMRAPTGGTASFFGLGGHAVAMVHNPGNKLALWVSFDGLKTWPYQRLLQRTTCGGPKDNMSHPHGFVSPDRQWLHFAFVDKEGRAVHYSAKLPPLP